MMRKMLLAIWDGKEEGWDLTLTPASKAAGPAGSSSPDP